MACEKHVFGYVVIKIKPEFATDVSHPIRGAQRETTVAHGDAGVIVDEPIPWSTHIVILHESKKVVVPHPRIRLEEQNLWRIKHVPELGCREELTVLVTCQVAWKNRQRPNVIFSLAIHDAFDHGGIQFRVQNREARVWNEARHVFENGSEISMVARLNDHHLKGGLYWVRIPLRRPSLVEERFECGLAVEHGRLE